MDRSVLTEGRSHHIGEKETCQEGDDGKGAKGLEEGEEEGLVEEKVEGVLAEAVLLPLNPRSPVIPDTNLVLL